MSGKYDTMPGVIIRPGKRFNRGDVNELAFNRADRRRVDETAFAQGYTAVRWPSRTEQRVETCQGCGRELVGRKVKVGGVPGWRCPRCVPGVGGIPSRD